MATEDTCALFGQMKKLRKSNIEINESNNNRHHDADQNKDT